MLRRSSGSAQGFFAVLLFGRGSTAEVANHLENVGNAGGLAEGKEKRRAGRPTVVPYQCPFLKLRETFPFAHEKSIVLEPPFVPRLRLQLHIEWPKYEVTKHIDPVSNTSANSLNLALRTSHLEAILPVYSVNDVHFHLFSRPLQRSHIKLSPRTEGHIHSAQTVSYTALSKRSWARLKFARDPIAKADAKAPVLVNARRIWQVGNCRTEIP